MTEDNDTDKTTMMQDQYVMLSALYDIAMNSEDAETVRTALTALTGTTAGRNFLIANPMTR